MAATFAVRASGAGSFHAEKVPGSFYDALIEVTGDATPGSGYAFGLAQLQTLFGGAYSVLESVEVANNWFNPTGPVAAVAVWDNTNGKIYGFVQGTAGAANLMIPTTASLAAAKCTLRVRFN